MNKIVKIFILSLATIYLTGCGSSVTKNIDKWIINEYAVGIYDISTTDDIIYFSIEEKGFVNTYKLDTENNCYKKNDPSGLNSSINGKQFTVKRSKKVFVINSVKWYYDDKKITEVSVNDIKSSGVLEVDGIKIATAKHLTSNITLGELNQSLCF